MVNKSGNKQLVARGIHKKQVRASERASRENSSTPTGVAGVAWKSAQRIVEGIFGSGTTRHRVPRKLNTVVENGESDENSSEKASPAKSNDDNGVVVRPLSETQSADAVRFMKRLHLKQDMWEFYGHTLLQWRANLFLLSGGFFTFLWTGSWEMSIVSSFMFVAMFLVYLTYLLVQSPNNHPDLKNLYDYYADVKENRSKRRFWVAMDEKTDQIVGTVAVDKKTTDVAQLKRMFVETSYRRRGIGTRLVNHVVEFCEQNSYKEIVLYSSGAQKQAQNLYEKCGFAKERSSMERILLWWFWEVCFYKYHVKSNKSK